MSETVRLTCETCGAGYDHPASQRGRPPKFCPEHRRPRGVLRDVEGAKTRAKQQRERKAAAAKTAQRGPSEAPPEWDESTILMFAALLPLCRTADRVARWMHLPVVGAKLAELEAEARGLYPDLAAGRIEATAHLMATAMGVLTIKGLTSADTMAPRDIIGGVQRLGAARGLLVGDERPVEFSSISLELRGSDGRVVTLAGGGAKGAA